MDPGKPSEVARARKGKLARSKKLYVRSQYHACPCGRWAGDADLIRLKTLCIGPDAGENLTMKHDRGGALGSTQAVRRNRGRGYAQLRPTK